MAETEERRQTGLRRLTELRAGHYKLICFVHAFCCIGMVIFGIVTLDNMEEMYILGPHVWTFILAFKLLVLAVTDVVIVTKGRGTVRNERGFISRLVIFQTVLAVLSVPCYALGYLAIYIVMAYKRQELLVVAAILYYISFVSSVFVACNCCYATCGCGTHKNHDTEQGVVTIPASEELSAPPSYIQYPCTEPPPSYTPYPHVDQSLEESSELHTTSTSCDSGHKIDSGNITEYKKKIETDRTNM